MAGIDIITAARDELEESLFDLRLLVEMAEDVAECVFHAMADTIPR
jgi:hypothetical protein